MCSHFYAYAQYDSDNMGQWPAKLNKATHIHPNVKKRPALWYNWEQIQLIKISKLQILTLQFNDEVKSTLQVDNKIETNIIISTIRKDIWKKKQASIFNKESKKYLKSIVSDHAFESLNESTEKL